MAAKKKKSTARRTTTKRRQRTITASSDTLGIEAKVFSQTSPMQIAASLKRSQGRRSTLRSAMRMLNEYIDRAGKTLTAARRRVLEATRDELKKLFGRRAAA